MGSATSSIPAEPIVAAAAVVGALGYGYVQFTRSAAHSETTGTSTLHGQKKRGRKLKLPGDGTLKNVDFLDTPSIPGSLSASSSASGTGTGTRQRQRQEQSQLQQQSQEAPTAQQSQDVVPGGFDVAVTSTDDAPDASQQRGRPRQQQQPQQEHVSTAKKPKRKKGKKAVPSEPSLVSGAGASSLAASTSTEGGAARSEAAAPTGKAKKASIPASANAADSADERWTRVEARKKKYSAPLQDGLAKLETADVTTSDAGITTSVTGNSSPVTERTTEDELPPEVEESVMEVSALQDAPPPVVPIRPPPGEQPAKGFSWEDYEGVQVDEDASGEDDGGWGVVRSRRRPNKAALEGGAEATTTTASQSQPQTKKQRQNAQRREALKEVKRERGAQQQAAFATHKRELERARAVEQTAAPKRTGSRFDSLG